MPYIDREDRNALRPSAYIKPRNPGELHFQIACLVDSYITKRQIDYATLNEVIGVLECAKLETYRRIVVPYEEIKTVLNGDVFTAVPEWPESDEGDPS